MCITEIQQITRDIYVYLYLAVCKFKAHKRCAVRATNNCKWTTLASIGKDIIEDEDGVSTVHIYSIFQSCFFFKEKKKKAQPQKYCRAIH